MPMPSPEDETKLKTDSGSGQTSDTNQHPPPQTQPPPVMGFPGNQQAPYPTYQQYPYAQAPPASYYGSSYPIQENPVYQRSSPSGFFRGIVTGLIVIFVLVLISTTITWFILRPQIPVISVTNFSVSNFNITGPVFSAQWTTNLTVENPNTKLKCYFDRIKGFIYNQNAMEEDQYLAAGYFPPVYLDTKKSAIIGETLTAGDKDQPRVPNWIGEEMGKERETGTVSFDLRMLVWVTFKTDGWSPRESVLNVFCGKLKVVFQGDSGNGAVLLSKPLSCLVYS